MGYNILHICPSFNNPLYSEIVERQIKMNKKVRVFYFQSTSEKLENADKAYVDAVRPFNNIDRLFFFVKAFKVRKAFEKIYDVKEYDLIHAHTLFVSGYLAYKMKKKHGIPYVVAVRGSDVNVFFRYRKYLSAIGIRIMENAESIIFISESIGKKVIDKYIPQSKQQLIKNKSVNICNGINQFWIDNAQCKKTVPDINDMSWIYYGDVTDNKNIELALDTAERFIKEGKKVKYTVIGKVLNEKYIGILKSKSFINYIDFKPKEELIGYLREADVFIMPSFSETFGLSYVEAMSQGVPVVYSKGQGIDGVFDEGKVGYHVNPNSVDELYDAIMMIYKKYIDISRECVKAACGFSWDSIVDRYQQIYNICVSEK